MASQKLCWLTHFAAVAESTARTKTAASNLDAAAKVQSLGRNAPKLKSAEGRLKFLLGKLRRGGKASKVLQRLLASMAEDIRPHGGGVLHCHRCNKRLSSTIHLSIHCCKPMPISADDMKAAGLVTRSCQCALCGQKVGDKTHGCSSRFFTTFALDCGALKSACITGNNFMEAQLSQVLRMTGTPLTVMVAFRCPKTRQLTVLPYLLGPSKGMGMGLYAGVDVCKGKVMMFYCGVPLDTLEEKEANKAWLAACKEALLASDSDKYIVKVLGKKQTDPTACGSVPSMVNCAHDTFINMSVQPATLHGRPTQIMRSSRRVQAGEERRDRVDVGLCVKNGGKGLYVPDSRN